MCTPEQLSEMLEELADYVKLAVDIERKVIAGGGLRSRFAGKWKPAGTHLGGSDARIVGEQALYGVGRSGCGASDTG